MAMSVVYTTINGMIVHETRGGVEAFYAPDTMGSTVALLNQSGTVTDTYTYWPYGEIRSHVGSSTTPLTFLGMIGYYTDIIGNFIYVRARYLRQGLLRWQTADPLWPNQKAYCYVSSSPVAHSDPSGMGFWNAVGQCGLGIVQGIGGLIGSTATGSPPDLTNILCSVGPPCIAALVPLILAALFPEIAGIDLCVAGAIGAIVASIFTTLFCNPPDSCRTINTILCNAFNSLVTGLIGCVTGILGEGAPVVNTITGALGNLFGNGLENVCMGQGGTGLINA